MSRFLRAGFSRVDITPPLQQIEAYGIGYWSERHVRFTGIRDPLFVRTLVIGVGESLQVVVSVDSIFDSYGFIESATRRIAETLTIPAANIFITCTHTHSSPLIDRNNTRIGAEYGEFSAQRITQSAVAAARNAVDASVTVAAASIDNVLFNRRPLLSNGRIAELHQPIVGASVVEAGLVNDLMTIISFRNRAGKRIGGLCHFGIHGVAVQCSELISSDCLGRAIRAVEREDESLVLLHLNGACADIDPISMGDDQSLDVMTERLVTGLLKVMNAAESPIPDLAPIAAFRGQFHAKRRQTRPIKVLEQARQALTGDADTPAGIRHHSGFGYESFLLSEEAAVGALPADLKVVYQLLRWGKLVFVGIGGEVFTRAGLALQASLPEMLVFPVGLTGGAAGYLPLREMYAQGGYEVACAQWCPIAPGESEKLFEQIHKALRSIAEGEAA